MFENLRGRIQKNFVGEKIAVKFWVIIYAYRICVSHMWVINRDFSKMSHDSLLTITRGFREVEKPTWVNFWRELWWNTKKIAIIRFGFRQTRMAFETPLAPGGLHFYFGPSGVKNIEHFNNKPFDIRLHRPAVFQLYSNSNFVVMKLVHRKLDIFWGLSMTRIFYSSLFLRSRTWNSETSQVLYTLTFE